MASNLLLRFGRFRPPRGRGFKRLRGGRKPHFFFFSLKRKEEETVFDVKEEEKRCYAPTYQAGTAYSGTGWQEVLGR